jgi:hypothetical protein
MYAPAQDTFKIGGIVEKNNYEIAEEIYNEWQSTKDQSDSSLTFGSWLVKRIGELETEKAKAIIDNCFSLVGGVVEPKIFREVEHAWYLLKDKIKS